MNKYCYSNNAIVYFSKSKLLLLNTNDKISLVISI